MGKGYILVEGHGEVAAVGNLINRMERDAGRSGPWADPIRWPNLHMQKGIEKGANYIRAKRDAAALLVLRDEDDRCPKESGPQMAQWLRALQLPFPAAIVLLHPEYEVLFLPCVAALAGQPIESAGFMRPGLQPDTRWEESSWEARRGVKEWLTAHFPPNRSYKPTIDQLPMTRMLDLAVLKSAGVPCFETLQRALAFLDRQRETSGAVYP